MDLVVVLALRAYRSRLRRMLDDARLVAPGRHQGVVVDDRLVALPQYTGRHDARCSEFERAPAGVDPGATVGKSLFDPFSAPTPEQCRVCRQRCGGLSARVGSGREPDRNAEREPYQHWLQRLTKEGRQWEWGGRRHVSMLPRKSQRVYRAATQVMACRARERGHGYFWPLQVDSAPMHGFERLLSLSAITLKRCPRSA